MEIKIVSVFEVLSLNGAGMPLCSNGLKTLDLFPEGTQKALKSSGFECFFYANWRAAKTSETPAPPTREPPKSLVSQRRNILRDELALFPLSLFVTARNGLLCFDSNHPP